MVFLVFFMILKNKNKSLLIIKFDIPECIYSTNPAPNQKVVFLFQSKINKP